MDDNILGLVRNTTDEVDSCDPYLGDQTLLVRGVWANPDSAAVPPGHRVTTPALHYTLARRKVLSEVLCSYHQPEALRVLQREGDSRRNNSPLGSVNNAAPGDASVS